MTKKINGEMQFSADPATVFAMVTDQAYVQEKSERTGGFDVLPTIGSAKYVGERAVAIATLTAGAHTSFSVRKGCCGGPRKARASSSPCSSSWTAAGKEAL